MGGRGINRRVTRVHVLRDCGMERWSDGGTRALAIILHRFTPVRDGWRRNEVWDLGVSTCT